MLKLRQLDSSTLRISLLRTLAPMIWMTAVQMEVLLSWFKITLRTIIKDSRIMISTLTAQTLWSWLTKIQAWLLELPLDRCILGQLMNKLWMALQAPLVFQYRMLTVKVPCPCSMLLLKITEIQLETLRVIKDPSTLHLIHHLWRQRTYCCTI